MEDFDIEEEYNKMVERYNNSVDEWGKKNRWQKPLEIILIISLWIDIIVSIVF